MSPPTVHPDDTITPDELYPNLQCSVFYRSDVNAHGKTYPSIASADVKKYPVGQSPYSHVMLGMMPGGISSKPRYVYVPEPMTYDEAKAHCIARYGNSSSESNLAHVRSGTEDVLAATAAVGCATEQLSKYECRSDHSGRGRTSVGGQVSLPSLEACAQYCCSYEASCFAFNYEGRTGRCTLMAHRFLPEGRDPAFYPSAGHTACHLKPGLLNPSVPRSGADAMVWIGLRSAASKWEDGVDGSGFARWNTPTFPLRRPEMDCTLMAATSRSSETTWRDVACSSKHPSLCVVDELKFTIAAVGKYDDVFTETYSLTSAAPDPAIDSYY